MGATYPIGIRFARRSYPDEILVLRVVIPDVGDDNLVGDQAFQSQEVVQRPLFSHPPKQNISRSAGAKITISCASRSTTLTANRQSSWCIQIYLPARGVPPPHARGAPVCLTP